MSRGGLAEIAKDLLHLVPALDDRARILRYLWTKQRRRSRRRPVSIPADSDRSGSRLMLDVSQLVAYDHHTGIQRVVRGLAVGLLRAPPTGFQVLPVYFAGDGRLLWARRFGAGVLGESAQHDDVPIAVRSGDIWFAADRHFAYPEGALAELHEHGVRMVFAVYDILPLRFPQCFYTSERFEFDDWLNVLLTHADEVICISRHVAVDLRRWLEEHPGRRDSALPIGHFYLGADLEASVPTRGLGPDDLRLLETMRGNPTMLMVGTLEPRKGYDLVLSAAELLWDAGEQLNLVIVGKAGTGSRRLVRRLRRHRARNRALYWLTGASDELLEELYRGVTALVAASLDEGFGLPLVEAAKHGLPIIARDIEVFREIAGEHAFYFSGDTAPTLARELRRWMSLHQAGVVPTSGGMAWLTWAQSTQQLLAVLLGNHWDFVWKPPRG